MAPLFCIVKLPTDQHFIIFMLFDEEEVDRAAHQRRKETPDRSQVKIIEIIRDKECYHIYKPKMHYPFVA